jgi:hypothetical protein
MVNKIPTFGSRIQVYRGHAKKTSGGLTKSDLMMNKHGRVVSKAKHFTAKKEMRLLKHGYATKKGKFGFVKVGSKKSRSSKSKRSRKMRGGMHALSPLDLGESAGAGITNFGSGSNDVQIRAGMAGGRRRRRSMAMYGGSGMAPMSPQGDANWAGDGISGAGITNFGLGSNDVQMRAGMTGGMSRAKARSLQRAKSRGMVLRSKGKAAALAMRGGTTSPRSQFLPAELSSVDVQMRAGLGN